MLKVRHFHSHGFPFLSTYKEPPERQRKCPGAGTVDQIVQSSHAVCDNANASFIGSSCKGRLNSKVSRKVGMAFLPLIHRKFEVMLLCSGILGKNLFFFSAHLLSHFLESLGSAGAGDSGFLW